MSQDKRERIVSGSFTPDKFDIKTRPFFIGVTGGTAGGKTSICDIIKREFGHRCCVMTFDCFYKDLTPEQIANIANINFDSPNALDFDLAFEKIKGLLKYEDQQVPIYSFEDNARTGQFESVKSQPIFIFEGILALHEKRFRDLMDLKIFVMTDDDIRLARRLQRDISERGRSIESVLLAYNQFVKKSYDEYIKPTMKYADIIIPHGRSNTVAIDFVIQNLKQKIQVEDVVNDIHVSPLNLQKQLSTDGDKKYEIKEVDSKLNPKVELLIQKIVKKEDEVLKDDYIQQLMQMLVCLGNQYKFNNDKMIFIPELIGSQGEQSAMDFISHAPAGSKIQIFTLVTSDVHLKSIQIMLEKQTSHKNKIIIYRLCSDVQGMNIQETQDELNNSMNQVKFIQMYDQNK